MSVSPQTQAIAFALCLAVGVGLGLLYDLLRLLRLAQPPRWVQEFLDLFFWLCASVSLFLCATLLWGGRVRLYAACAFSWEPQVISPSSAQPCAGSWMPCSACFPASFPGFSCRFGVFCRFSWLRWQNFSSG